MIGIHLIFCVRFAGHPSPCCRKISLQGELLQVLFFFFFRLRFFRPVGSTNMLGLALNGSDVSGSTLKTTFRGRGRIYLQLESAGSRVIFNPLKSLLKSA